MTKVVIEHSSFRVLICLSDRKWRTLEELTDAYNALYPPPWAGRMIGFKKSKWYISNILNVLVETKYVEAQLFSFIEESLTHPKKQYVITRRGLEQTQKTMKKR